MPELQHDDGRGRRYPDCLNSLPMIQRSRAWPGCGLNVLAVTTLKRVTLKDATCNRSDPAEPHPTNPDPNRGTFASLRPARLLRPEWHSEAITA